ncbi:hypothetical protein Q4494_17115 [Celeribacter halophilus]|uniref:Peptidase MA superfamily protein n=1 Tax=Celeribacter halophilus TaxID=576117 RepID=A0AAW7Y1U3_9RHOB|nr:hypothetical protein [Celeribacter halophilus]MDO6458805.1 hypothetical protein [Celeribacter halophilus]
MIDLVELDKLDSVDGVEVEYVLRLVCSLFGECDPRVRIVGAFFGDRRYPHTVYMSETNRFQVAICIPRHQADDPLARLVHLSHELVHCLSPNGWPPKATHLEEGLAEHSKVYLSQMIFQDDYPDFNFRDLPRGEYRAAFELIEELVQYEGLQGMRDGISKIRMRTKLPFCEISESDLAKEFVRTPQTLLEKLSKPFKD